MRLRIDSGAVTKVRDSDSDANLLEAARQGRRAIVRILLEAKANSNTLNRDGSSPLAEARARRWRCITNMSPWRELPPCIERTNHLKYMPSYTPSCRAAQSGSVVIVRSLLQRGVETATQSMAKWEDHEWTRPQKHTITEI